MRVTSGRASECFGEDVRGGRRLLGDDVRVDPERDGGISVAEAGRHDVDGDAGQEQGRGVDVAEVVRPGVRQALHIKDVLNPATNKSTYPPERSGEFEVPNPPKKAILGTEQPKRIPGNWAAQQAVGFMLARVVLAVVFSAAELGADQGAVDQHDLAALSGDFGHGAARRAR